MPSITNPSELIQLDEDDDDFDWEAAVKEIDIRCQATKASTSHPPPPPPPQRQDFRNEVPQQGKFPQHKGKISGVSKQSTLDRFVQTTDRKQPQVENRSFSHQNEPIHVVENQGGFNEQGEEVCHSRVDLEAAKTWIYPDNDKIPRREYQLSITKTALFSNTLVALPTGLGKTLIAAVVMYNYFRWFPEGKIVFTAPSRPLVMQQIEACHNIVGIPQEWTIEMTGQMTPPKRACCWKDKRVFFVTPQVLEKDIQSGTCLVKNIVCLVIDEAHRATGNYAYCVVVRELMAVPVQFRILALTATPGSKQQAIQNVINNLHISKLEYRNDDHPDVCPHVHDRKLELIEVPMSDDAIEINKLLLEAVQPFVTKLSALGMLYNKDIQTLSPHQLLSSREIFRQAPPQNLPQAKYGELEGYFAVLITLYHVIKLLSSHGVRPAYEMLSEKVQQGSSARLLSRNEVMHKTKLLMQRNLSHGAPNPKLTKMTEILMDHFRKNDPKNSRVIIFSNFRGSVRDIMDSLSNAGESVKATEFIGQNSGKALKGQTQKEQQAVLQKFRAGGFNVIVATSIGEEGLDIMEVDLVICFDANISPLRMIQRMGRTGRKNDGRVVVLACKGSELKGYHKKQANNKALKKHMNNGGINSFDFHASPRMIPHICRPEVQFVQLAIEQYVPRGKKVKDDSIDGSISLKMSDAEIELISKYFHTPREGTWKPSLIAFPHFQVFPSRVQNVMHSFRTGLLIDTMQQLQGLSETTVAEGETSSFQSLEAEAIEQGDIIQEDLTSYPGSPEPQSDGKAITTEASSPVVAPNGNEKSGLPRLTSQDPSMRCFLYSEGFVSVDAAGVVSILSVPGLPFMKATPPCMSAATESAELLNAVKQKLGPSRLSPADYLEFNPRAKRIKVSATSDEAGAVNNELLLSPKACNSVCNQENVVNWVERDALLTPSPKRNFSSSEEIIFETPGTANKYPILNTDEPSTDLKDMEMSPRLTNMVEEGVVPESPVGGSGYSGSPKEENCLNVSLRYRSGGLDQSCNAELHENEVPVHKRFHSEEPFSSEDGTVPPLLHVSPAKSRSGLPSPCPNSERFEKVKMKDRATEGGVIPNLTNEDTDTPPVKMNYYGKARKCSSDSPVNESAPTPLANLSKSNSCSKGWRMSSGESSNSVKPAPKFKRLRKNGDTKKQSFCANLDSSFASTRIEPIRNNKDNRKTVKRMNHYIEEEAEVSVDAEVYDDEEEEDKDNDSYDSFIDDRINPTIAATQAEAATMDTMAMYRRSLLSQPIESQPIFSTDFSLDILSSGSKIIEVRSSSGKVIHSSQTPQMGSVSGVQNPSYQRDPDPSSLSGMPPECSEGAPREESKIDSRKRKLSFCQPEDENYDEDDDKFYEGVDFDELEAQATKILGCKSALLQEKKQWTANTSTEETLGLLNSPSFDLGI
ncbi:DEAD-box ATP-dependent RNA helicase FANCM-like [Papaver somniferum]|uniref:DEAD-box ATP-dependent RNA helicase FANCM-like n=1 Tax=Papaver somniferum TaxID=3469 RepID=UPI000E6F87F2|nr:DEAD-box ATP-dependent RNA helicase FANCM-like [Papaver somniferum]